MELKGRIVDLGRDYKTGNARITLEADDVNVLNACNQLTDKDLTVKLVQYRKKRSLDANAYFWLLAGKLAAKLNIRSKEIYREYVRNIGDNFDIVPVRNDAKERWIKNWKDRGEGWICEDLGSSKPEAYSNVICYFGSSAYDTKQMSCLIDLVVTDCKEQGIETMAPNELAQLKAMWGENEKHNTA